MVAVETQSITNAIKSGDTNAYSVITYYVEEDDAGLSQVFSEPFVFAKTAEFKGLVTVCHSAPFGITDAMSTVSHNWLCFGGCTVGSLKKKAMHIDEAKGDYIQVGLAGWIVICVRDSYLCTGTFACYSCRPTNHHDFPTYQPPCSLL
jgi:hypothetical protein